MNRIALYILILITLVCIGIYTYPLLIKPKNSQNEIVKLKHVVNESDDLLELIDSNSNRKVSIKIPRNISFDTSYHYGKSILPNTKKMTENDNYYIDDYNDERITYVLHYTPKLIIPTVNAQNTCEKIIITGYKEPYLSILNQKREEFKVIAGEYGVKNYTLNEKEFILNNHKSIALYNPPSDPNNHMDVLIQVDDSYSIIISNPCTGAIKDGNNNAMVDLFTNVVNSFTEIK